MLEIKNKFVKLKDEEKEILKDFNLNINSGEIHALMGPNGTGKSTLSKVIFNNDKYVITNGDILFEGRSIKNLKTDEIARLGLFLSNQLPPEIDGVTTSDFLRTALNEKENIPLMTYINKITKASDDLHFKKDMIHRNLNKGFSGGEKKKNEILQLKMLEPKFIILDEIDSGLDVDSLKIVSDNINDYIKEHKDTSILIITHYPRILEYIKPDYVHVMTDGQIKETGSYDLALEIEKNGNKDYKDSANKISE